MATDKVVKRAMRPNGRTMGKYDPNPCLTLVLYDVEFADGQVKEYATFVIMKSMLIQDNSEGNCTMMLEGIIDYKRNDSVTSPKEDQYVYNQNG